MFARRFLRDSSISINPSPLSVAPTSASSWITINSSVSDNGIISENGVNAAHGLQLNAGSPPYSNNIPYRFTVWSKALNRAFILLTIAPDSGASRRVFVFGLNGEGLLDSRSVGSNPTINASAYESIGDGIYKMSINFTMTSGGSNMIPVIEVVDKNPPTYTAFFDATFQGLSQPSLQILGIEMVAL